MRDVLPVSQRAPRFLAGPGARFSPGETWGEHVQDQTKSVSLRTRGEDAMKKNKIEEHPELKLKGITHPLKLKLLEYNGPFSSDFGRSYVTVVEGPKGGKRTLWLNEKTTAGKAFFQAVREGELSDIDMGGKREFVLVPKDLPANEEGEVFTIINLRWGKVYPPEGYEEGQIPSESVPF